MNLSDKRTYVIQTWSVREALLKLTSGDKASTPIYPWTTSGMRNAFHAGLYNDACYGNVYLNTVEEFLKR